MSTTFSLPSAALMPSIERDDANVLNESHVIATFTTRNSRYTLVKRAGSVVLHKDGDRDTVAHHPIDVGMVITGDTSLVEPVFGGEWTRYVLRIWKDGEFVFASSYIESAHVLEN